MKKIISTLAIVCLSISSFAQNVDEIVKKHIEAIGGKENWSKVKSLKTTGSMKAQGAEILITMTQVDKTASRQDITLMGMNGYSILTKTEGWNFMPFQGQTKPEPITADDVAKGQEELNLMPDFLTYKEEGKKLEYISKDDVDGTECFKLKMTSKDKKETTYYIDPSTYYIIKETNKVTINGKEIENSSTMSNYKKQDCGIVYPFSIGGGWGELEVTALEVNPKVDESIFKIAK
jgi:hypothetical protein